MKTKVIIFIIIMFSIGLLCQNDSLSMNKIQNQLSNLETKVDQTISNQLNYKIEKDLIKETYSNNYDRIQIIISIVLGLITLFGIIGINSINKTKKEYEKELNDLKNLKSKLENDYFKLSENQENMDKQINELNVVNQVQDSKLKILEIKEKTVTYLSNKNYIQALEYITIGINLEPKNISLLRLQASIYSKMLDFEKAIKIHKLILKEDPSNNDSIEELAELYLLTKNNDDFKKLKGKNRAVLSVNINNMKSVLFDVLLSYNEKNIDRIKDKFEEVLSTLDDNVSKKLIQWDFYEINNVISKKNSDELSTYLHYFINIIDGHWNKKQYEAQLKSK